MCWKDEFVSDKLSGSLDRTGNRFKDSLLGRLPVPLPSDYVAGIDLQMDDLAKISAPVYLFGVWSHKGWWYYYLAGFLVKLPIGTLLLIVLAGWHYLSEKCRKIGPEAVTTGPAAIDSDRSKGDFSERQRYCEFLLLVPPVTLLVILSAYPRFDFHFRYALPSFGFLFVLISRVAVQNKSWPHPRWKNTVIAATLMTVVSTAVTFPHTIAYFNVISGHPALGRFPLLHSSLDWGQGLYEAESWLKKHAPNDNVFLSCMTLYDPADLGISYLSPVLRSRENHGSTRLPAGLHLVSINMLYGQEHGLADGRGGWLPYDAEYYHELRKLKPIKSFGNCMQLFRVTEPGGN